ncbi:MAG: pyridoxamine 5'-phosphate oxidase family protein [Desulfobacteraceae bacterium]|nr:pyridoxamine 5'-phosphate oxidase family protein [Desulfobacteraceae bacterium]
MVEISEEYKEIINKPGRIGTLSTVDAEGKPNVAYFGSPRLHDDGTFAMGLAGGRTLQNLKINPNAVFFCVEEGSVSFATRGCRLYLKVREIQTEGPLLDLIKEMITKHASEDAANMMQAAVAFDVTEVRPLLDMGG